jgi:hypothetical protein
MEKVGPQVAAFFQFELFIESAQGTTGEVNDEQKRDGKKNKGIKDLEKAEKHDDPRGYRPVMRRIIDGSLVLRNDHRKDQKKTQEENQ